MMIRRSTALAALGLTLTFGAPLAAQETDVAKEGAAPAAATDAMNDQAMGEGCSCSCGDMKAMHQGMMKTDSAGKGMKGMKMGGMQGMKSDSSGAAAHMHAGMDPDAHAAMMEAHKEMMANCPCMSGEKADGMEGGMQGMSCPMHGQDGDHAMHGHDMKGDDDAAAEAPDADGR